MLFPADFVVLDIAEDHQVSVILGRPFLATGGALTDAKSGQIKLRVDDEELCFDVPKLMKMPGHLSEEPVLTCDKIADNVVDEWVKNESELCNVENLNNELNAIDLEQEQEPMEIEDCNEVTFAEDGESNLKKNF